MFYTYVFQSMLLGKNYATTPIATTKIKGKKIYIQQTAELTLKCKKIPVS